MGCETRRSNRNQEDTSSTRNLLSVLLFVVGAERRIIKNELAPGARRQGSGFPGPLGGGGGRPRPRCRRRTRSGRGRSRGPGGPRSRCFRGARHTGLRLLVGLPHHLTGPAETPPRLGRGLRLRRAARELRGGPFALGQAARVLSGLARATVPGWFLRAGELHLVGEALRLRRVC